jgi:hypothetical protein
LEKWSLSVAFALVNSSVHRWTLKLLPAVMCLGQFEVQVEGGPPLFARPGFFLR